MGQSKRVLRSLHNLASENLIAFSEIEHSTITVHSGRGDCYLEAGAVGLAEGDVAGGVFVEQGGMKSSSVETIGEVCSTRETSPMGRASVSIMRCNTRFPRSA